ncbi:alpha/beta hydrolase [Carnimonas bestiolae]|uniref:alpha/beta hydrolase n=1 Tax=Carnimonas bestiolae TaxID=3402172 RepID=UPI003EDC7FE8
MTIPHVRYWLSLVLLLVSATVSLGADAQPQMKPLGPSIADKGSAYYRFRRVELDSQDHQRHYRVWVAIPKQPAPQGGYPIVYAMDGNSAIHKLNEPLLKRLSTGRAPVIVAVGYQTDLPFDVTARAYDYTPPVASDHGSDPWNPQRRSGGSDTFRALLLNTIQARAEQGLSINSQQRSLWGHSYGGLFVLDTLFSAPDSYAHYYAASPSLGWSQGKGIERAQRLGDALAAPASLTLFHGGDEVARHRREDRAQPNSNKGSELRAQQSPNAARDLAKQLGRIHGLTTHYRSYPALSHGPMFGVSLEDTLLNVAGLPMSDPAKAKAPAHSSH